MDALEEKEARREKKPALLLAADEGRRAKGSNWEDERRNCAPPSSARFSGRITGAPFPRDPRRNAKRELAQTDGKRDGESQREREMVVT